MIFNYFFANKQKENKVKYEGKPYKVKEMYNDIKDVYLVLSKNTYDPIGIYSTYDKAKKNGERSTYHSCIIIKYRLNGECKFLKDIIYESQN